MAHQQNCPYCHSTDLTKNGSNTSGTARFKCRSCHKTLTLNGGSAGRPLEEGRKTKLSNAERQKRWRQQQKLRRQQVDG